MSLNWPDPADFCSTAIRQLSGVERSCLPRKRMAQFDPEQKWWSKSSIDHLVGAQEEGFRNCEADRLRRLEIDHKFELGRLLDGQLSGFAPLRILSTYIASR